MVLEVMVITLLSLFPANARPLTLVQNSEAHAVIVIPKDPTKTVTFAAEELVEHIEAMSGARLAVIVEDKWLSPPKGVIPIYLGPTAHAERLGFSAGNIPEHGFIIHASRRELLLVGDDTPARGNDRRLANFWNRTGSLSAVYGLLQDEWGVRWLWPGEVGRVVPKKDTLQLSRKLRITQQPDLINREIRPTLWSKQRAKYHARLPWIDEETLTQLGHDEWVWLRRMRMGRAEIFRHPPGHAFESYWDEHRKEHPEYFAMLPNGLREPEQHPSRIKMCVSEPSLWSQIASQHQPGHTLSVAENDGDTGYCTCERCRSWDVPEATWIGPYGIEQPSLSDRYARFFNAVAQVIE